MKYIRTKDGVYEVVDNLYENGTWYYKNNNQVFPFKMEKVKVADTIEELCDEFIQLLPKYKGNDVVGYEHEKWEYSIKDKKFYNDIGEYVYVEDFVIMGWEVYGAIWMNKGLIYVAKMNQKGDLELL